MENALGLSCIHLSSQKPIGSTHAAKTKLKQYVRQTLCCGPNDGLDRPALPRLPPSLVAARAALYRDADHGGHPPWRPPAAAWLRCERASGGAATGWLGSA